MDIKILNSHGIDYDKGVARFMGDSQLYEMVLVAFLSDTTMERAEKCYAEKDYPGLFSCAHEMKGSCGNVDMTELYLAASVLVDLLRAKNCDEKAIDDAFTELRRRYTLARDGIEAAR